MDNSTTSISDLPTDPVGGGNIPSNINLIAKESSNVSNNVVSQNNPVSLDQTTINQIVNGLQQASASGITQLPSRDIPMNTNNIVIDPGVQPNFVPPPPPDHVDYIKNYNEGVDIINDYNKNIREKDNLDDLYSEIQTPLLLAVLFFLFQLPFFRKYLFKYFPVLFSSDGNLNINGYLFISTLFGLFYYLLQKVTVHFNTF
jgi:hypothetical protein